MCVCVCVCACVRACLRVCVLAEPVADAIQSALKARDFGAILRAADAVIQHTASAVAQVLRLLALLVLKYKY